MTKSEGKGIWLNSAKMITANGVGQMFVWLAYPLLTRLYSPDELGEMSLFLAIVGLLTIAAAGQYEHAIMIEKRDEDAGSATFLCLLLSLLFCFLTAGVTAVLSWQGTFPDFVIWIAPLVLFSSWGYILSYWNNRNSQFNRTAFYQLSERFAATVSRIVFGWTGFHSFGLIVGSVLGQFIGLFSFIPFRKSAFPSVKFRNLSFLAKKWRSFPLFVLPHKEINALALNMPVFFFSAWFNMAEVGFFALAVNVGLRPVWSFGRAVHQVYYQKMGRHFDCKNYNARLFRGICLSYIRWAIPVVILLYLTLPMLTEWLFGIQWVRVGSLLQTMLPWIAASTLAQMLSFIPNVYAKQAIAFIFEIIIVVVESLVLFFGVLVGNLEMAVSMLSIVCSLVAMAQLTWYYLIIRSGKRGFSK